MIASYMFRRLPLSLSLKSVRVCYAVAPIIHVTKLQQTLQDQPRQHRGRGCHKGRRHSTGRDAIGDAQGRATVEAQPAEPKKASSLGKECLEMVGRWLRRLRVAFGDLGCAASKAFSAEVEGIHTYGFHESE